MTEKGFVTTQQLKEAMERQREIVEEETLPEHRDRASLVAEARLAADMEKAPLLGKILVDMQVEVIEEWRGERALPLYQKDFQAGTITFGGNKSRGFQSSTPVLTYIVIIQEDLNIPDPVK